MTNEKLGQHHEAPQASTIGTEPPTAGTPLPQHQPIFFDASGHRRAWMRATALLSAVAGLAFMGSLVLVLDTSPANPVVDRHSIVQAPGATHMPDRLERLR